MRTPFAKQKLQRAASTTFVDLDMLNHTGFNDSFFMGFKPIMNNKAQI
jgi:hypothetical protein